jgi:archaellum biogenesis ATPase FlaH
MNRECWTLADLLNEDFPELIWYAERIFTAGLTLLWGSAKAGKSIFISHALLAISSGSLVLGQLKTQQCQTLYISLEDGPRRLQKRLKNAGAIPNENFVVHTDWKRGSAGIKELEMFLDKNPGIKVVCIDTFVLFTKASDYNDYGQMSDLMSKLKKIADDRDLCIIAVHHSKKTGKDVSGEITESALGSTGIVAGPDHLLFLKRTPAGPTDAVLHYISKDTEPAEIGLNFDKETSGWIYAGEADELIESDERQEIIEIIRNSGPISPGEIQGLLSTKKSKQAVCNLLSKMVQKGQVNKISRGKYEIPNMQITHTDPMSERHLEQNESSESYKNIMQLNAGKEIKYESEKSEEIITDIYKKTNLIIE